MKNILKYLSALCPCPLSLFLCRSFLPILNSTQPCFWGLLQALSCSFHSESWTHGMFNPCPSQQVLNLSDESFIAKFLLLALSAAGPPSAGWALPTPICVSLAMGTEKPPGTEPQQRLGQVWMGRARPSLLLDCSWRVPSVLQRKAFHGRSVLQDCKYRVHEPTELSRAGIFMCERIFCKQSEKSISLCVFGAWD